MRLQKAHPSQSLFCVKVQFLVSCVAATEEANQFVVLSADTVVNVCIRSISVKFCKPSMIERKVKRLKNELTINSEFVKSG
jgi:hypothetical protein